MSIPVKPGSSDRVLVERASARVEIDEAFAGACRDAYEQRQRGMSFEKLGREVTGTSAPIARRMVYAWQLHLDRLAPPEEPPEEEPEPMVGTPRVPRLMPGDGIEACPACGFGLEVVRDDAYLFARCRVCGVRSHLHEDAGSCIDDIKFGMVVKLEGHAEPHAPWGLFGLEV